MKKQRPIYYAILSDKYDMVKFLIDRGADLRTVDKKNQSPALYAKRQNKPDIHNLLV